MQNNIYIHAYRGRKQKPILNLKLQDKALESVLGPEEMQFLGVDGMPYLDVGGTEADCQTYRENKRNGFIVKEVSNMFGTDGVDVYVGVCYAKYPNQIEYQQLDLLMQDIPEVADHLLEYRKQVEITLKKINKHFRLNNYFLRIGFVKVSEVCLTFCNVFFLFCFSTISMLVSAN